MQGTSDNVEGTIVWLSSCSVTVDVFECSMLVVIFGMFGTNRINLSFKVGPSRPWKYRVCCFLLYQLMIKLLLVLFSCFAFPTGDDHLPCCCKSFLRNSLTNRNCSSRSTDLRLIEDAVNQNSQGWVKTIPFQCPKLGHHRSLKAHNRPPWLRAYNADFWSLGQSILTHRLSDYFLAEFFYTLDAHCCLIQNLGHV